MPRQLTKTVGDTTHEYFYNDEVLNMEVVKVKDVVTEYRSYEWNGYTPLGMMVKAKNESGTFETVKEGEPKAQVEDKSKSQRPVADLSNLHHVGSVVGSPNLRPASSNSLRIIVEMY
ncbi:hypothetical protein [Kurthia sibirica]|uniref:Uncharacterized protein n=1 Tax=Kurthia sibirica TaxID=202750 RepID=A0A2U3AFB2_9BACL|nr:hypothetical protein [Kurthia sibirica]PWI23236.1 hypothetical protein DEX24_16350 [Kurthia sibirica]GEK35497.1 hypothetical protein KSI01_30300 [Kurthia sibirica]